MNTINQYVQWLRDTSPYINAHRQKTFVVMLPGEAVLHDNFSSIVHDIALLHSLGVKLVLVHGARPQIDARLQEQGVDSQFTRNLRVTDAENVTAIKQAVGETRISIEAALSTGLPNSPMHGAHLQVISGNFVTGMPHGVIDGIDLQLTGKVRNIDVGKIDAALNARDIVLLPPMGYSVTGECFNLAYTDVAVQVAQAIHADKLIAFTDTDGISDDSGQLIPQLSLPQCEAVLDTLEQTDDSLYLLTAACVQACQQGVPRAQLINYQRNGALLTELFTRDGSGTMIYRDHYEQLRQASISDVAGIIELLTPLEEKGILVKRSRELLEQEIHRFVVMEKDNTVIACAALYPYGDDHAELACVATHPGYRRSGRAATLLQHIELQARQLGHQYLFSLTTQTAHWFLEQGFQSGSIEQLPDQRRQLYNFQRNSKVFIKSL